MYTHLHIGQKVLTPDGEGTVEQINGEMITVKLDSGQIKIYYADQVLDDSSAG